MTGDAKTLINWLLNQDSTKVWDITEHREKRSKNANAYAWALIGKIADVFRANKEDVYVDMLKKYGQSTLISVLSHIDISPYCKYFEEAGRATLQGKEFIHYRVYKGSSEFDTREMAILIDGIVSEAKDLEIETMTPDEIAKLKEEWKCEV